MQSHGNWYLAMEGKLLRKATTSVKERISSTLWSQKKKVLQRQTAKNPYLNQECGFTFFLIGEAQICVSPDYIPTRAMGRHVTRWKQFFFFLVQQSRKLVAEPHPCSGAWAGGVLLLGQWGLTSAEEQGIILGTSFLLDGIPSYYC